jgi:hypothetical protein
MYTLVTILAVEIISRFSWCHGFIAFCWLMLIRKGDDAARRAVALQMPQILPTEELILME